MTLSSVLVRNLCIHPNKLLLGSKKNNIWKWHTKQNIYDTFVSCRKILKRQNISKGDRIAFKGKNSLEWLSWNLATNSLGAVWVPMYEDQSHDYCRYIMDDCEPTLFLTNDLSVDTKVPMLDYHNIDMDTKEDVEFVDNSLCTLIYTSGTTGNPKGVMLSNENILSNIQFIHNRFYDMPKHTCLNILPWAHIYSQTCELYYNVMVDNKIAISSNRESFIKECSEIQPSCLYLVPRVLDMIYQKLSIFDAPVIRVLMPLCLRYLFGFHLQYIFTGGAKLNQETRDFFHTYGYVICEGYGCTETSPMISVNHFKEPRNIDSIGKKLDNLQVEIVNGEIQVRGRSVMMGYWNNKDATEKVLTHRNGHTWYKTGDSGRIEDGYLFYNGRISDNYKLSNGKFVNVEHVEDVIKRFVSCSFIVFGENKTYNEIISTQPICNKTLDLINKSLDSYLKIQTVHVIDESKMREFLTPKMSIKRKPLIEYIQKTS